MQSINLSVGSLFFLLEPPPTFPKPTQCTCLVPSQRAPYPFTDHPMHPSCCQPCLCTHANGQEEEAAESFRASLATLEKATELGDSLTVRAPRPKRSPTPGTSAGNASGTTPTTGGVEATGEAMLRLAKLCDAMSAGDSVMSGVGGRRREELAALAVKEYLRAMAVG